MFFQTMSKENLEEDPKRTIILENFSSDDAYALLDSISEEQAINSEYDGDGDADLFVFAFRLIRRTRSIFFSYFLMDQY